MAVNIILASQRMEAQAETLEKEAATLVDKAKALIVTAQAEADKHLAETRERAQKIEEQAQDATEEAFYWRNLAASERAKAGIHPGGADPMATRRDKPAGQAAPEQEGPAS